MRHNGRAAIAASTLAPNLLSLHHAERPQVRCPDCTAWRLLRRGMLAPHRAADGVSRCAGSGQRIALDLAPAAWLAALQEATRHAALRHNARVHPKAAPPPPPAVHRIAAAR